MNAEFGGVATEDTERFVRRRAAQKRKPHGFRYRKHPVRCPLSWTLSAVLALGAGFVLGVGWKLWLRDYSP